MVLNIAMKESSLECEFPINDTLIAIITATVLLTFSPQVMLLTMHLLYSARSIQKKEVQTIHLNNFLVFEMLKTILLQILMSNVTQLVC